MIVLKVREGGALRLTALAEIPAGTEFVINIDPQDGLPTVPPGQVYVGRSIRVASDAPQEVRLTVLRPDQRQQSNPPH